MSYPVIAVYSSPRDRVPAAGASLPPLAWNYTRRTVPSRSGDAAFALFVRASLHGFFVLFLDLGTRLAGTLRGGFFVGCGHAIRRAVHAGVVFFRGLCGVAGTCGVGFIRHNLVLPTGALGYRGGTEEVTMRLIIKLALLAAAAFAAWWIYENYLSSSESEVEEAPEAWSETASETSASEDATTPISLHGATADV